jgi:prepilin-type N-terminal cleavage/methylation domain-containing protein
MKDMINKYKRSNIKYQIGGFTLVEMIVSVAVFAIVAVVAGGAILKVLDTNKKAQSIQSAITNLNFSLETMTRELRIGSKYYCTNDLNDWRTNFISNNCPLFKTGDTGVLAFRSSEELRDSDGNICSGRIGKNKVYVYRFTPIDGGGGDTYIRLQKAEEPDVCRDDDYPFSDDDFIDMISIDNVNITNWKIDVINAADGHPFAQIRIIGFAGTTEKDKTYFDIQTGSSARLP